MLWTFPSIPILGILHVFARLREGQDELQAQAEAYNRIFFSFHIRVKNACDEEYQRFKQELRAHYYELSYTNYKDHPQYSFTVDARFWVQLPTDFSFDDYEFRSRKRVKLMPLDEDDEREMNSDEIRRIFRWIRRILVTNGLVANFTCNMVTPY